MEKSDAGGRPLFVGLTGGIGSGKTTVANVWRDLGITVVDADQIARSVIEVGGKAVDAVAAEFGSEVIEVDGAQRRVNRVALADIVFNDDAAKRALEMIVHPMVEEEAWSQLRNLEAGSVGVYDVPLLIEGNMTSCFDAVVIVLAEEELRIERLERRGMSPIQAKLRIEAQASDEQRLEGADIVIYNNSSLESLTAEAKVIGSTLSKLPHKDVTSNET